MLKVHPKNGIEDDATCRWCRRHMTSFKRPGQARYGKNQLNRRVRRVGRDEIRAQLLDLEADRDPDNMELCCVGLANWVYLH